jgi:hypothetical protein
MTNGLKMVVATLAAMTLVACGGSEVTDQELAGATRTDELVQLQTLEHKDVEALQELLARYAAGELMPVPERDLCGGIPCPVPAPLVDLPQDPVPLSAPVAASASNENPDDPCGVGPRPVGPQPTPEPVQQLVELAQQLEEVMEQ